MVEKTTLVLTNRDQEQIVCDVRMPAGGRRRPAVVIFHSFMAFKDWGWFPFAGERIAEEGFVSVIANFSRNGVTESPFRITDFATFERNTVSHELADAKTILEAVVGGDVGHVDSTRVAVLGHSRGGGIAILIAAQSEDVRAVVTWSSVCTFDRWSPHQKEQWRRRGFLPLSRDTEASPLRLGLDLLEDVESNGETLDLLKASARLRKPWLILHGREDLLVKLGEAERLYSASHRATTEFFPLDHTGHTYGGPEVTDDSPVHAVLDRTIDWLKRHV